MGVLFEALLVVAFFIEFMVASGFIVIVPDSLLAVLTVLRALFHEYT